jgi:hypothetical protein
MAPLVNEFQNVGEGIAFSAQVRATQRYGYHLGAAGGKGVAHGFG